MENSSLKIEINKMKKILVILSLLFIISIPRLSYAENNVNRGRHPKPLDNQKQNILQLKLKLLSICKELDENLEEFSGIVMDLQKIQKLYASPNLNIKESIGNANMTILFIETIFSYERQLLSNCLMIKKEYELNNYSRRISDLKIASKNINTNVELLRVYYALITNTAALHLIDKAKLIVKSSLKLFDKSIETLKSIKREIEKSK
ncbi:MAG: hypothetical protein JRF08_01930 [Deltaproteobacteria bacterium]|nr:hypothetical protein [Deltaproteobacteria bacterium]